MRELEKGTEAIAAGDLDRRFDLHSSREFERISAALNDMVGDLIASQQAVRDSEARIREADRLESLGLLAGGVAHDFNNLLVGILGQADLALAELPDEGPGVAELRRVRECGRRRVRWRV